jgi:hypothetical protein
MCRFVIIDAVARGMLDEVTYSGPEYKAALVFNI